jgi:predicted GIY-YIG superfamily endonuclease
VSDDVAGVVYLLHFHRPYKHARHYMGFSTQLGKRLEAHRTGNGARLMEVITGAGIGWTLARTWIGDRTLERRLKRWHKSAQLCPICRQRTAQDRKEMGMAETTEVCRVELACCTQTLLREIAEPLTTRDSLALTYALAICSSEGVDWGEVNAAIIRRWSLSALEYIKRKAWKRIEEKAEEHRRTEERHDEQ